MKLKSTITEIEFDEMLHFLEKNTKIVDYQSGGS
jgi:hypothetical protein